MSPLRALAAVALLVAVPVFAGFVFGFPTIGGFGGGPAGDATTPEPFVEVETSTPTAVDRQTVAATETASTEASSKTSAPDDGTLTPTPEPTETATATPERTASPTPQRTASPTDTDRPQSTPEPTETVPNDTPTETDSPTTDDSSDSDSEPTEPATSTPPATDGGTDERQSRQCTNDREGHAKPPLPDATTPPNDAARIEAGSPVDDEVGIDGTNWYAVRVEKGETLSVHMEGSPEELSVAIFAPDGTPVDALDVSTPDPTVFGATVAQSGTYYVRVDAGDGFGGSYTLTAERATPDRFDPNDRQSRALPVANGSETLATLTEGETDWYAIKLPANSSLSATVRVESHALGRDVRVHVFDAEGNRLSQPRDSSETTYHPSIGSNTATASTNVSAEGVYYVRVDCAALDGHAAYTLTVETDTNN